MPRVKRGVTARAKHKKVFEFTKGHRGRRKNVYRVATQSMDKALQYSYRDRRYKKREGEKKKYQQGDTEQDRGDQALEARIGKREVI